MVGGTVLAFLGGLHYWWPKMTGRMYTEGWPKFAAFIIFVGFNLTFFPQFMLGYLGMPRRYHTYPPEFQTLHVMTTAGASILGVGMILPVFYLLWSLWKGKEAGPNPWGVTGLEWTAPSPPPVENFPETPVVTQEAYHYSDEPAEVIGGHHATTRQRTDRYEPRPQGSGGLEEEEPVADARGSYARQRDEQEPVLSDSASITPATVAGALTGDETFVTTPGHGTGADTHGHGPTHVQHQFDDAAQQKDAVTLGMWGFLATEIMFFGGAFLMYSIYRNTYPEAFKIASNKEIWWVGFFNTLVLLASSYTVVLAVYNAHHGNNRGVIKWIVATILCLHVLRRKGLRVPPPVRRTPDAERQL